MSPIQVVPNRIELSNFEGGYSPDASEATLPATETPDVLNFLPDPAGGHPKTRAGYSRLTAFPGAIPATHWIRHVNYFERISSGARERYLIMVLSTGVDNVADNIQVWSYNLSTDAVTRVDTAGRAWTKAKTEHWFAVIEGTCYGGTRNSAMYSWNPTAGWVAAADTATLKTLVNAVDDGYTSATEWPRDYAFKKGRKVIYSGSNYQTATNIRFTEWDASQAYSIGDKVSRKTTWVSTNSYWKSFRCIKGHEASDVTTYPGSGSNWRLYWHKVKLGFPVNADAEIDADWFYLPTAGRSSVGIFHGSRLWLRRDDEDNWSRLQYSAPLKPEKDEKIADLVFDPTDWAPHDDIDGNGGGWLPQLAQSSGDAIRALASLNQYLVIAMRWSTSVLVGTDESQWTLRPLGKYGAVGPQAITELDGLIYMLSPAGTLVVTDGTTMQEAPGVEKVRRHIKKRLDDLLLGESNNNWQPTIQAYNHLIWMSFPPNPSGAAITAETLVYNPRTAAFWLLDLPTLDMAVGPQARADRLFFSTPYIGSGGKPAVFKYTDDATAEVYTDDDPNCVAGVLTTAVPWRFRSPWFQFGTAHSERRIRRTWGLVDTSVSVNVKGFRDYSTSSVYTAVRTGSGTRFVEGQTQADSHALALSVDGASSPATLIGFGADTEPRRTRFHRG